ncbi:MAG TPA: cardiolipin synthase, partial [Planctomycetaceae bacterium]|nr:cardiolipin synthase [Planctomycetaceae bacterium]
MDAATIAVLIHISLEILVIMRVILRPHREPTSRLAWIVVVVTLPVIGILAYLLLGEVNIGRRRVARMQKVIDSLPKLSNDTCPQETLQAQIPDIYDHLFRVGRSISGYSPVGGNSGQLLADSNTTINRMVEDIDSAQDHVHLLFYIWLPDQNGCKIIDALKRAAERGVKCRAMVDGLGSRILIKSPYWNEMTAAGIHTAVALPIGNPLLRPFVGRIDLRNHRKIVVIDHNITYCGSQNCADPEFRIKPRYAPWVDAVIRFQGPVARQNQHLFIS